MEIIRLSLDNENQIQEKSYLITEFHECKKTLHNNPFILPLFE